MKKYLFFILIFGIIVISGCTLSDNTTSAITEKQEVTIFKSDSCGCCDFYKTYLGRYNFKVNVVNSDNMISIKEQYGIPFDMQSCHTTIIGDYFVEGHMPIEAVEKLLKEKPDIKGIALPDMPSGSPGMTGYKYEQFTIYSISKDGVKDIFMKI